jgi:oxygen-independent coproporphyrinogen-3 oxidase
MLGLYIHIPFCSGKCGYCDFVSFPDMENMHAPYIDALEREMRLYSGTTPDTLYIGGGTPTELETRLLKKLLLKISGHFIRVCDFSESTIEVNPESVSRDKIVLLRQFGINRVSMGLQSFDDALLKSIGRRHDSECFMSAYADLRAIGFDNINIDLMAGIPGQTTETFADTLARIVKLSPEHISVYGLEIGEHSKFSRENVKPDEDLSRTLLDMACEKLENAGYLHYEISNFAKPGRESRHNTNYWDNGEYIGLGCSATSYLVGVRKTNAPMLEMYCSTQSHDDLPVSSCEKLEGKEKNGETLMLGLRKLGGMKITEELDRDFGSALRRLADKKLIMLGDGTAKLTREGVYLSNEVFREFVPPFD